MYATLELPVESPFLGLPQLKQLLQAGQAERDDHMCCLLFQSLSSIKGTSKHSYIKSKYCTYLVWSDHETGHV